MEAILEAGDLVVYPFSTLLTDETFSSTLIWGTGILLFLAQLVAFRAEELHHDD